MQFLAAALPGFRELRAPLTAGYLWLVILWLLIKPDIKTRPSDAFLAAGYDLATAAGPFWIALATGVAAYLVGSVSQSLSALLGHHSVTKALVRFKLVRDTVDPADKHEQLAKSRVRELQADYQDIAYKMIGDRAAATRKSFADSLELPAILLLTGEAASMHADSDRLKAEAELRLTTFPPSLVLGFVLACNGFCWWGLALIAVSVVLFAQAHQRARSVRFMLLEAARRGMVRGATFTEFEGWVSGFPRGLIGDERAQVGLPPEN